MRSAWRAWTASLCRHSGSGSTEGISIIHRVRKPGRGVLSWFNVPLTGGLQTGGTSPLVCNWYGLAVKIIYRAWIGYIFSFPSPNTTCHCSCQFREEGDKLVIVFFIIYLPVFIIYLSYLSFLKVADITGTLTTFKFSLKYKFSIMLDGWFVSETIILDFKKKFLL
jgi:hypothetical protein